MRCATMAEPVDLPFGLWTWVGRRKHKFNRILQVAPVCPHGKAHWRHLANTTEPSVCGVAVVLTSNYVDHLFTFAATMAHDLLLVIIKNHNENKENKTKTNGSFYTWIDTDQQWGWHTMVKGNMALPYVISKATHVYTSAPRAQWL